MLIYRGKSRMKDTTRAIHEMAVSNQQISVQQKKKKLKRKWCGKSLDPSLFLFSQIISIHFYPKPTSILLKLSRQSNLRFLLSSLLLPLKISLTIFGGVFDFSIFFKRAKKRRVGVKTSEVRQFWLISLKGYCNRISDRSSVSFFSVFHFFHTNTSSK